MPFNPKASTQDERNANTMQPVVVSVKPARKKTHPKLTKKSPTWLQHEHAPWCAECSIVHAYFEGYGPMDDDCTVLVVNPTDPHGAKFRVLVDLADIAPIESETAAEA